MKASTFLSELWLPKPLEIVFAFFADPENLEALTPAWLTFALATPRPVQMRPGTLLDYRLRLHGLPIRWRSEITAWEPPSRFVDEQRHGPYKLWVHEHRFQAQDNGTQVTDLIRYDAPGGWLLDRLFVRRDLERIFQYRRQKLLELFPQPR